VAARLNKNGWSIELKEKETKKPITGSMVEDWRDDAKKVTQSPDNQGSPSVVEELYRHYIENRKPSFNLDPKRRNDGISIAYSLLDNLTMLFPPN